MKKTKYFSPLVARLIIKAIEFITNRFTRDIESELITSGVKTSLEPIKQTVLTFSDDNPKNIEQLEVIWKKFAHDDVYNFGHMYLPKLVDKIKNEDVKTGLRHISIPTLEMVRLLNDDNPKDDKQLESLWLEFIKNPDTHNVVLYSLLYPALKAKFEDNEALEFVLELIEGALGGVKIARNTILEEENDGI